MHTFIYISFLHQCVQGAGGCQPQIKLYFPNCKTKKIKHATFSSKHYVTIFSVLCIASEKLFISTVRATHILYYTSDAHNFIVIPNKIQV